MTKLANFLYYGIAIPLCLKLVMYLTTPMYLTFVILFVVCILLNLFLNWNFMPFEIEIREIQIKDKVNVYDGSGNLMFANVYVTAISPCKEWIQTSAGNAYAHRSRVNLV